MIFQLNCVYTHSVTVKSITSTTDRKEAKRTNKTLRGIIILYFKLYLYFSTERLLLSCKTNRKFRLGFINTAAKRIAHEHRV